MVSDGARRETLPQNDQNLLTWPKLYSNHYTLYLREETSPFGVEHHDSPHVDSTDVRCLSQLRHCASTNNESARVSDVPAHTQANKHPNLEDSVLKIPGSQLNLLCILTSSQTTSWWSSGKSLNISKFHCLHLWHGNTNSTALSGLFGRQNEAIGIKHGAENK